MWFENRDLSLGRVRQDWNRERRRNKGPSTVSWNVFGDDYLKTGWGQRMFCRTMFNTTEGDLAKKVLKELLGKSI